MELNTQLVKLENAQLVRRTDDLDLAYLFKHALTQEAAYASLLLKRRQEIHQRVAVAYEHLYPERLEQDAGLLAQHYAKAGDHMHAFAYAVRAGEAAAQVYAYVEARMHYALALDALSRLPDTTEYQKQRVDTIVKQVSVSLRAEGPTAVLKRLAEAEALARPFAESEGATREDRLRLARVQFWQGHALIHQNERRAAIQSMRQVLTVAKAENDPQLLAIPASVIGRALVAQGQFAQAVPIMSDAIAALEQTHDENEWVLATGFRGVAQTMMGDHAAAIAEIERALAHASEANTLIGIALAHATLAIAHLFRNEFPFAVDHARAVIETAAKSGERMHTYLGYGWLAWAQIRGDDCADSENNLAQTQLVAQGIGGPLVFADWFAAARAERALRCGQYEQASALAAEVVSQAQNNTSLFAEGIAERVWGQALAMIAPPRRDESEIHFKNSLVKLEEGGAHLEAARTQVAWGQALKRRGDMAARLHFEHAATQFQVSGLEAELAETRAFLGEVQVEG